MPTARAPLAPALGKRLVQAGDFLLSDCLCGVMLLRQFTPEGNEEEQLSDSISSKKKIKIGLLLWSLRDPRRRLAACPSDVTCSWCSSAGG